MHNCILIIHIDGPMGQVITVPQIGTLLVKWKIAYYVLLKVC